MGRNRRVERTPKVSTPAHKQWKRTKYKNCLAYRAQLAEKQKCRYAALRQIPEFKAWRQINVRICNHRRTVDSLMRRLEHCEKELLQLVEDEKLFRAAWTRVRLQRRKPKR